MPSAERLITAPLTQLPGVVVEAPGLTLQPSAGPNAIAAADAANDATYRTTLQRGGLVGEALGLVGRALGALTLILTPGNTGPDRTGELNEPLRSPTPELDPVLVVGSTQPGPAPVGEVGPGSAYDLVELPEITIRPSPRERSNPLRLPAPDVLPEPLDNPFDLPFGVPGAEPFSPGAPSALPRPNTRPETTPSPGVQADPLSDPFSFPRLQPNPEPAPRPNARPSPEPSTRPQPTPRGPIALPLLEPQYFPELNTPWGDVTSRILDRVLNPEPGIRSAPEPDAAEDPCDCGKGKKKDKKKRKKPEPRTECWKGTYVQRARGISYSRKERVACTADASTALNKVRKVLKKVPKFDPLSLEF